MSWLHRILHHHWPEWMMVDYDMMSWRWACVICEPWYREEDA